MSMKCPLLAGRRTDSSEAAAAAAEEVAGDPVTCETGPPVAEGPPLSAAAARHARTAHALPPPGLRAVTYNILAEQYAATEYAREHLFSYCPARWACKGCQEGGLQPATSFPC